MMMMKIVASVVLSLILLSDERFSIRGRGGFPGLTSAAPLSTPPIRQRTTPPPPPHRRLEHTKPTQEKLVGYLTQFGYLRRRGNSSFNHTDKEIRTAMRRWQRIGRVKDTGLWNNDTIDLFHRPRCGLPDDPSQGQGARRKRYTFTGGKWPKSALYYRVQVFSSKVKPLPLISVFEDAFEMWSSVVPLTFQQTYTSSLADLEIGFYRLDHKDGFPFDGPGGILSHTFQPTDGRVHFDEDEAWTINSPDGIDIRQVAAHEFGHLIGMGHSNEPDAIMYPYYPGYQDTYRLSQDDINGAQALYGVADGYVPNNPQPSSSSSTTTTTTTTTAESPSSITSPTTTTSSPPSLSSPIAANAVLTPKIVARLTPVATTASRVTAVRTTPRR